MGPAVAQTTTTGYVPTTSTTRATTTTTTGATTSTTAAVTTTTAAVTTTTGPTCPASVDLGTLPQGGSGSGCVGGFQPNVTVNLSLNGGNNFGTATTNAQGSVTVTVNVTSGGTNALARPVFAVQGLRLGAATASVVTINGVPGLAAKIPGEQNIVTVSGTGSNGAARTDSVLFKVTASSAGGAGLSRTGAMILRSLVIAAILIALGAGALALARRRGASA